MPAAGHAILAAAGGIVIDIDGKLLTYDRTDDGFIVPGFVARGDPTTAERFAAGARQL